MNPLACLKKLLSGRARLHAIGVVLAALCATPALSEPRFRNIEIGGGFNVETITVEQENGRWTRITDHERRIPVYVKIEMSSGYIQYYRVGRKLTNGAVRDIFLTYTTDRNGAIRSEGIGVKIDSRTSLAGEVPVFIGGTTRLNASDEQMIVDRCNAKLSETGPGHAFSYTLPLAVHADARQSRRRKIPTVSGGDYEGFGDFKRASATGFLTLKIECLGNNTKRPPNTSKPPSTADSAPRSTDASNRNDPIEVKMDLDIAGGNACPRNATITTRLVYRQPKTATFDIVRNGKVLKTVEIKARREALSHGPTQWVIDRIDTVEAKAGQNQFRIVVKGGGKSAMKVATIECAPFQILFSDLKYNVADTGACPKKVWETATFQASGPGEATLQLIQENGSVFYEKKLKTILKNGKYSLVGQRVLEIDRDTDIRVRAQIKGQSGIRSKWARLKVSCPKRTNATSSSKPGPKQLTTQPATSAASGKRVVQPLVCRRGKVSDGICECRANAKPVKIGDNAFACRRVRR